MHSKKETRIMHATATIACASFIALGICKRNPLLIALGPLADYAIAQTSHRLFEKNKTKPWKNPLWHAHTELRLLRLTLIGR
jgi:hypothetical protein